MFSKKSTVSTPIAIEVNRIRHLQRANAVGPFIRAVSEGATVSTFRVCRSVRFAVWELPIFFESGT